MLKDFKPIDAAAPDPDDLAFVEKYWSAQFAGTVGQADPAGRVAAREEYRALQPHLDQLPPGAEILDAGCGQGDWTVFLSRQGRAVTGLDISQELIARLGERFPECRFLRGDIRNTGFAEERFDLVFSWGAIEHFEAGVAPALNELRRLLKPGGALLVTVPFANRRQLRRREAALTRVLRDGAPDPKPQRFYQWRFTRGELAQELRAGGFDVLSVEAIHKDEGIRRMLRHGLRLSVRPGSRLEGALLLALRRLIPSGAVSHMLLAVARKPWPPAPSVNADDILLHVGYHKTGTTFLQRNVFPALDADLGVMPGVDYIAEAVNFQPEQFRENLRAQLRFKGGRRTVISQEALTGRSDGNLSWNAEQIAERLQQTFPKAKILIVVRNQPDYILSLYAFRVVIRGLDHRSLNRWLQEKFDAVLVKKMQYDRLVKKYMDLFPGRVLVLPFEMLRKDNEAFVRRILQFGGFGESLEYDRRPVNEGTRDRRIVLVNRLLNAPFRVTTQAMRDRGRLPQARYSAFANRYYAAKSRWLNPALRKLLPGGGAGVELDDAWRRRVDEAFRESNRRLSELIGIDLSEYGYACR